MSKKISELTDASSLDGSELIEVVQGGDNKKVTVNDLLPVQLQGDKTIDLNGHIFQIIEEDYPVAALLIDPTNDQMRVTLEAFNETGNGNYGYVSGQGTDTDGDIQIAAAFNDGEHQANIHGAANASSSSLSYTADTHTFNVAPTITELAGGGTTGLSIDNDGKIIRTP